MKFRRIISSYSCFLLLMYLSLPLAAKDIRKQTVMVNGDFNVDLLFSDQKMKGQEDVKSDYQEFNISTYYFIVDNFALGLRYFNQSQETEFKEFKSEVDTYSIVPGALINFSIDDKTSAQLQFGYMFSETEFSDSFEDSSTYKTQGWLAGAGLNIFFVENVSLDFTVHYFSRTMDRDDLDEDIDTSGFNAGMGLSVYFN